MADKAKSAPVLPTFGGWAQRHSLTPGSPHELRRLRAVICRVLGTFGRFVARCGLVTAGGFGRLVTAELARFGRFGVTVGRFRRYARPGVLAIGRRPTVALACRVIAPTGRLGRRLVVLHLLSVLKIVLRWRRVLIHVHTRIVALVARIGLRPLLPVDEPTRLRMRRVELVVVTERRLGRLFHVRWLVRRESLDGLTAIGFGRRPLRRLRGFRLRELLDRHDGRHSLKDVTGLEGLRRAYHLGKSGRPDDEARSVGQNNVNGVALHCDLPLWQVDPRRRSRSPVSGVGAQNRHRVTPGRGCALEKVIRQNNSTIGRRPCGPVLIAPVHRAGLGYPPTGARLRCRRIGARRRRPDRRHHASGRPRRRITVPGSV